MACTGRAYAVRRFLGVIGIQPFFVPPVMPVVTWLRHRDRIGISNA